MRLGFVSNFISAPVLTGFKAGIGLVIVLDQVPKLLGIHITKQGFFVDLPPRRATHSRDPLMTLAVPPPLFAIRSEWSVYGRTLPRRWLQSAAALPRRGSSACKRSGSR